MKRYTEAAGMMYFELEPGFGEMTFAEVQRPACSSPR
jgi:hypothetical protein